MFCLLKCGKEKQYKHLKYHLQEDKSGNHFKRQSKPTLEIV